MTKQLIAIAEGIEMGRVGQDPRGKLSFTYSEEWRSTPGGLSPLDFDAARAG